MKMDEQEYQDKLKVRTQLSLADKFRVLEHEFDVLRERVLGQDEIIAKLIVEQSHVYSSPDKLESVLERVRACENDLSAMKTITPIITDSSNSFVKPTGEDSV